MQTGRSVARLTAVLIMGVGFWCPSAPLRAEPPTTASLEALAITSTEVMLFWTAPTEFDRVERAKGPGAEFSEVFKSPKSSRSWLDTQVAPGQSYAYRVCAGKTNCTAAETVRVPSVGLMVSDEAADKVFLMNKSFSPVERPTRDGSKNDVSAVVEDLGNLNGIQGLAVSGARGELFVANTNQDSIVVYAYPAPKTLGPKRVVRGTRTQLHEPTAVSISPTRGELIVLQEQAPRVLVFPLDAEGEVAPRIPDGLGRSSKGHPVSIAVSSTGDRVFLGYPGEIQVVHPETFTVEASFPIDGVTPSSLAGSTKSIWVTDFFASTLTKVDVLKRTTATIAGSQSGLDWPQAVAVLGNEVAVANFGNNSLTLFSAGASGGASPLRIIEGARTGLALPRGLASDEGGRRWIVANYGNDSITAYEGSASGNAIPVNRSSMERSGISRPRGIFVHNCEGGPKVYVAGYGNDALFVFSIEKGALKPQRVLRGASTGLHGPEGVVVDPKTHEIFVANLLSNSITVYSEKAGDGAKPIRTIQGEKSRLRWPYGLAIDPDARELFVSNVKSSSISVFAADAHGDTAPLRTLEGTETALAGPEFMHLDGTRGEIYVANALGEPSVSVFKVSAGGNVAPLRRIGGPSTGLDSPESVVLDPETGTLFVSDFRTGAVLVFGQFDSGDRKPRFRLSRAENLSLRKPTGLFFQR